MLTRMYATLALMAWLPGLATAAEIQDEGASPSNGQDAHLQALVSECEACHGPGGVSSEEDVPSLAGQSATYLRELLEQFYYYERHCPTTTYRQGDRPKTPMNMCNVANALSEEDKDTLAEYFSRQEFPTPTD